MLSPLVFRAKIFKKYNRWPFRLKRKQLKVRRTNSKTQKNRMIKKRDHATMLMLSKLDKIRYLRVKKRRILRALKEKRRKRLAEFMKIKRARQKEAYIQHWKGVMERSDRAQVEIRALIEKGVLFGRGQQHKNLHPEIHLPVHLYEDQTKSK